MAVVQDHSRGLDPKLLRSHVSGLQEADKKRQSANGAYREHRKKMKADGINLKAYDFAVKLMALDPAEGFQLINDTYFIMKSLNSPLGSQLNFHEMTDNDQKSEAERAERWKADGSNAFLSGKRETDCPHALNMPAGQAWITGFREAESEARSTKTAAEMAEPNPVDNVPKQDGAKPRGRPPGSKNKPTADAKSPGEATSNSAPPAPPAKPNLTVVETKRDIPVTKQAPMPPPPKPPAAPTFAKTGTDTTAAEADFPV